MLRNLFKICENNNSQQSVDVFWISFVPGLCRLPLHRPQNVQHPEMALQLLGPDQCVSLHCDQCFCAGHCCADCDWLHSSIPVVCRAELLLQLWPKLAQFSLQKWMITGKRNIHNTIMNMKCLPTYIIVVNSMKKLEKVTLVSVS
jgi:hypothetical protein